MGPKIDFKSNLCLVFHLSTHSKLPCKQSLGGIFSFTRGNFLERLFFAAFSFLAQCSIFHLNVTNSMKITKIWPEKKSQFILLLGAIWCQRGTYMVISFNSDTYLSKSIAYYSNFFKNSLIFEVHQK